MQTCDAPSCSTDARAKGLCSTHYERLRLTGSVELRRPSVEDRFWAKVDKSDDAGCWLWTASVNTPGYGHMRIDGVLKQAHRISYELAVGPIPARLVIDHLCRNLRCVRPSHLEPVTDQVNVLRGIGPSAMNARKAACSRGHTFDATLPSGERYCRTCARDRYLARSLAVL